MKKTLSRFTIFDLVLAGFMAALGIAIKPFIMPIIYFISTPLLIPGGSLAGGFYMMWLILGTRIINKPYTCSLIALIQAVLVITSGSVGNHGILSLIIYIIPGIVVDIIFACTKNRFDNKVVMALCCLCANVSGLLLTNILIYHLPILVLATSLSLGALSGFIGGLLSHMLYVRLNHLQITNKGSYYEQN